MAGYGTKNSRGYLDGARLKDFISKINRYSNNRQEAIHLYCFLLKWSIVGIPNFRTRFCIFYEFSDAFVSNYFIATQLQYPPLESVVEKYNFAVKFEPDAANFTIIMVFVKRVPTLVLEFQPPKM